MTRHMLLAAFLTGTFCAALVMLLNVVGNFLSFLPVVGVAFVSGFCGSLFASLILGRRRS